MENRSPTGIRIGCSPFSKLMLPLARELVSLQVAGPPARRDEAVEPVTGSEGKTSEK